MAKRIRKKTKEELAAQEFQNRSQQQAAVLTASWEACDKLSKKRRQFILDIADNDWIARFEHMDDEVAYKRESRKWDKLRAAFLAEATKPLELHWFSCNWNADRGLAPLLKVVKNVHCDAGTALRLYWINDPYYLQDYHTIAECDDEDEQEILRLLRTIERRFNRGDFATSRIPFDPTAWVDDAHAESAIHVTPEILHVPILQRRRRT